MAVYFVLRSHYEEPSGKLLRRFDDATVLDWFRRRWGEFEEAYDAHERTYELLGWYVDPFIELFEAAFAENLPAPETDEQLEQYLHDHVECESTIRAVPHCLTIRSVDECNMESCSYLFDDVYLARHADRAAFLLHEGWQLPSGHSETGRFRPKEPIDEDLTPVARGSGTTYFVILFYDYDNDGNLTDLWGAARIKGVRIPQLASYLAVKFAADYAQFLPLLRSQLFHEPFTTDPLEEGFRQALLSGPEDEDAWRSQATPALMAYTDWLQEQQDRLAGLLFLEQALKALCRLPVAHLDFGDLGPIGPIRQRLDDDLANGRIVSHFDDRILDDADLDEFPSPELCHVHVEEHLAQLCLNTEHWRSFHRADLYQQWIFFDDLWAAAHPVLANAILRYARCWDVLSPDGPHDRE